MPASTLLSHTHGFADYDDLVDYRDVAICIHRYPQNKILFQQVELVTSTLVFGISLLLYLFAHFHYDPRPKMAARIGTLDCTELMQKYFCCCSNKTESESG